MNTLDFKRIKTIIGGEISGYQEITTYEYGNWIIEKNGGWGVVRKGEFFGYFKTLKEAKKYIQNWLMYNPEDL